MWTPYRCHFEVIQVYCSSGLHYPEHEWPESCSSKIPQLQRLGIEWTRRVQSRSSGYVRFQPYRIWNPWPKSGLDVSLPTSGYVEQEASSVASDLSSDVRLCRFWTSSCGSHENLHVPIESVYAGICTYGWHQLAVWFELGFQSHPFSSNDIKAIFPRS